MKWYYFLLFFLMSLQLLNVASEASTVDGIEILEYGLFTTETLTQSENENSPSGIRTGVDPDSIVLFRKTERIPAVLGLNFGIRYRVKGSPRGQYVPITCRVLLPGIANTESGRKFTVAEWTSQRLIGEETFDGYIFEKEWELLPGNWTFQLFYGGEKLAEKNFIVEIPKGSTDNLMAEYYYAAHTASQFSGNFKDRKFIGRVGANYALSIDLSKQGNDLNGHVRHGRSNIGLIEGKMDRKGNAMFVEYQDGKPTGAYKGKFDECFLQFKGKWINAEMNKEKAFTMTRKELFGIDGTTILRNSKMRKDLCVSEQLINVESSREKFLVALSKMKKMKGPWVRHALIEIIKDKQTAYSVLPYAIDMLAKMKEKRAIGHIISYLSVWDTNVKEHAIEALLQMKVRDKRVIEPLLINMEKDSSAVIREKSVDLLTLQGQASVKYLLGNLESSKVELRVLSIKALGQIRDPMSVEPLIRRLKDDSEDVRAHAADALGKIGKPAIKPLIEFLQKVESSIQTRFREEYPPSDSSRMGGIVNFSPSILLQKEFDARTKAAEALGNIGKPALKPLLLAWEKGRHQKQAGILKAFGHIRDKRSVKVLIDVINSGDADLRGYATSSLIEQGDIAVNDVIVLLDSESAEVAQAAAYILGALKDARAVEPLIAALYHPDGWVRDKAAEALGQIGDLRAVAPLLTLLEENLDGTKESLSQRRTSPRSLAYALSKMGDPRAAELISMVAVSYDDWYTSGAELGELREPLAEKLISFLRKGKENERLRAARLLGQMQYIQAAHALCEALKDDKVEVRKAAAFALGQLKDHSAVEPLISLLSDQDVSVFRSAVEALAQIKDEKSLAPLVKTLSNGKHNDDYTKAQVQTALLRITGDYGQIGFDEWIRWWESEQR